MDLYDAHNHFQDERLRPHRDECLQAWRDIGLKRAVVNGTAESDWAEVAELAKSDPRILPSYGLHPWFLRGKTTGWAERLAQRLEGGGVIGEIGLDRWKTPFDVEEQKEVFRTQLRLATQRELPVTVHCLKAWGALMEILREEPLPRVGFLLHAYSGPLDLIHELVKLGAYFSFSGYFLNERKSERRAIFGAIPLDRLLVETDAPAMSLPREKEAYHVPVAPGGEPLNHPGNLFAVYRGLAEIRGLSMEVLAQELAQNFERLFGA